MRISEPGEQEQARVASRAEKQVNTSLRSLDKSSFSPARRVPVVANFNNKESQFTLRNQTLGEGEQSSKHDTYYGKRIQPKDVLDAVFSESQPKKGEQTEVELNGQVHVSPIRS